MNTYQARVQVPSPLGHGKMVVWAHISAANTIAAKSLLEAQYGRGNVIGVPVLVR